MKKYFLVIILLIFIIFCIIKTFAQEKKGPLTFIDEAIFLSHKGQIDMAETTILKSLEIYSNNPYLHYHLGKIYREQNKTDRAIEEMNKTIEIKRDMVETYYDLAFMYEEKGLKGKAADCLKKGFQYSHLKSNSIMAIKFLKEMSRIEAFPDKEQIWTEQSIYNIKGGKVNSIFFTDEANGIAVGTLDYTGEIIIIKTADRGNNWELLKTSQKGSLTDILFIDKNNGWAVGYEGDVIPKKLLYKTTDGGITWKEIYPPDNTKGSLNSIFFIDKKEGWTAGGASIYNTIDGGQKWFLASNFTSKQINFNKIFFINSETGWVCGSENTFTEKKGVIYKTIDRGKNWTKLKDIPLIDVKSLFFIDSNKGWAAGWDGSSPYGSIIYTSNGGKDWVSQNNIIDNNMKITDYDFPGLLNKLYFIDGKNGWTCGFGRNGLALLLKTSNGGETWYREDTDSLNISSFNGIFFLDINKGWLTGEKITTGPVIITNKK